MYVHSTCLYTTVHVDDQKYQFSEKCVMPWQFVTLYILLCALGEGRKKEYSSIVLCALTSSYQAYVMICTHVQYMYHVHVHVCILLTVYMYM